VAKRWVLAGRWQELKRRCPLIAYEKLGKLTGFTTYEEFRAIHSHWVNEYLGDGGSGDNSKWTGSIAVGCEGFIEKTKDELGIRAKGRKVLNTGKTFQIQEPEGCYRGISGIKDDDIGAENSYFSNIKIDLPT